MERRLRRAPSTSSKKTGRSRSASSERRLLTPRGQRTSFPEHMQRTPGTRGRRGEHKVGTKWTAPKCGGLERLGSGVG